MKVLFIGYPQIGSICLEHIMKYKEDYLEIVGVCTKLSTNNKAHKSLKWNLNILLKNKGNIFKKIALKLANKGNCAPVFDSKSVVQVAEKYSLSIYDEKLIDINNVPKLKKMFLDLIVVASFGKKIPKEIIEIPTLGIINFHPSLLPLYRGGSPGYSMILDGETEAGSTVHFINENFDEGDMICQNRFRIEEGETAYGYETKAAQNGAKLILEAIDLIKNNRVKRIKQESSKVVECYKYNEMKFEVQWENSAEDIERQVKASKNRFHCAYTYVGLKKIYLSRVEKVDLKDIRGYLPGDIIEIIDDGVIVKSKDNGIKICDAYYRGKYLKGKLLRKVFANKKRIKSPY